MIDFLKSVGRGLLGIIIAPFYLVGLLLYAVYSIFLFLFYLVRVTFCDLHNMFSKKGNFVNPFKELPEDIMAKTILAQEEEAIQNPTATAPVQNVTNVTYNIYGVDPTKLAALNPNNINNQLPNGQPINNPNQQIENQNFASLPNNNVINAEEKETVKKERRTSDVVDDDFDGGEF